MRRDVLLPSHILLHPRASSRLELPDLWQEGGGSTKRESMRMVPALAGALAAAVMVSTAQAGVRIKADPAARSVRTFRPWWRCAARANG